MMACLPMNDKVVDITQSTETADAPKTKVYRSMIGNGRISPATRQRVLDYVKKHNCTLDVPACEADNRCSYNISLVISKQFSDFEMPFLRKIMRSVYYVAGEYDYDVLLTLVDENETRPVGGCWATGKLTADFDPHAGARPAYTIAESAQAAVCRYWSARG